MRNRQSSPAWLKAIFAISVYIFALTSISWSDFLVSNIYGGPIYFFFLDDLLEIAATIFQFFIVVLFLIVATILVTRRQDRLRLDFIVVYGLVTLLFVGLSSLVKDAVHFSIPGPLEGLPKPLDTRTIYITVFSGFLAVTSRLYSQFSVGRKDNGGDST